MHLSPRTPTAGALDLNDEEDTLAGGLSQGSDAITVRVSILVGTGNLAFVRVRAGDPPATRSAVAPVDCSEPRRPQMTSQG